MPICFSRFNEVVLQYEGVEADKNRIMVVQTELWRMGDGRETGFMALSS